MNWHPVDCLPGRQLERRLIIDRLGETLDGALPCHLGDGSAEQQRGRTGGGIIDRVAERHAGKRREYRQDKDRAIKSSVAGRRDHGVTGRAVAKKSPTARSIWVRVAEVDR